MLLALKKRTPVANMGKLRSIGQIPVVITIEKKLVGILVQIFNHCKVIKKYYDYITNLRIDRSCCCCFQYGFYGRHHHLGDRYGIFVLQMTTDMFHLS